MDKAYDQRMESTKRQIPVINMRKGKSIEEHSMINKARNRESNIQQSDGSNKPISESHQITSSPCKRSKRRNTSREPSDPANP